MEKGEDQGAKAPGAAQPWRQHPHGPAPGDGLALVQSSVRKHCLWLEGVYPQWLFAAVFSVVGSGCVCPRDAVPGAGLALAAGAGCIPPGLGQMCRGRKHYLSLAGVGQGAFCCPTLASVPDLSVFLPTWHLPGEGL